MYAVIETGGKQYRVEVGTVLAVERLEGDPGQQLEIERVLLIADGDEAAIGRPVVDGARVTASVLRQDRADKVIVFKYRPKARRRVKHGHRQEQTVLRIEDILHGGRSAAALSEAERAEDQRRAAEAAEAAERQAAADRALADRLAASRAEATAEQPATAEEPATAEQPATPAAKRPPARRGTEHKPAPTKVSKAGTGPTVKAEAKPPARPKTQAPPPESKGGAPRGTKKETKDS
jgi:large subunit ribosomal protein L21